MNDRDNSTNVGGRGRGNMQNLLQCDNNSLINNLRRPYLPPPEVKQDVQKNSALPSSSSSSLTGNQVAVPMSVLSADAPEFIPRSDYLNQSILEHGPSDATAHLQFDMLNCIEQASGSREHIHIAAEPQLKYVYHPLIVQINDYVVKLSLKPHKFDQIADKMTSVLSAKGTDQEVMKEVISVIFEQGVGDPNFRFNGGRLCQHLCKYVSQLFNGLAFKSLLLQRCQEEYNCRGYYMQTDPSRLCGFTLFLSDIFSNVLTATSQPLEKLGEALCTLLMLLLSLPSDMTLKCAVQTLKAIGSLIDRGKADNINAIMYKVKDIALTAKIPDNIRSQLLSVVELRASNWGKRRDDICPTNEMETTTQMGTIYYGADGTIERIEEETYDSSTSDSEDSQISSFPVASDEMDGEIAFAFEEFLRSQKNTK